MPDTPLKSRRPWHNHPQDSICLITCPRSAYDAGVTDAHGAIAAAVADISPADLSDTTRTIGVDLWIRRDAVLAILNGEPHDA